METNKIHCGDTSPTGKRNIWDKNWLYQKYFVEKLSTTEIGEQVNKSHRTVSYWLGKYGYKGRTISEARKIKRWGSSGSDNGMSGMTKELNPNWRGGITPERQSVYISAEWKDLVQRVRKRDIYKCLRCNTEKSKGNPIHIHHIKSFADEDLRMDINNLASLCKFCHDWVHSKLNTNKDFIIE